MALQVGERNALVGAGIAAGLPTIFNQAGIDGMLAQVADDVFEGDRGRAKMVVAGVLGVMGIVMVLAATVGPLNGNAGITALSLGVSLLAIAAEVYLAGGA